MENSTRDNIRECENTSSHSNGISKTPGRDSEDPRKPPRGWTNKIPVHYLIESSGRSSNIMRFMVDFVRYVLESYAHYGWEPDPEWDLPDTVNGAELFRKDVADAIIRYRNGVDLAFQKSMYRRNRSELLNPNSPKHFTDFLYEIVHNIFTSRRTLEDLFHCFLPYLAFVVDITVYLLRYHTLFRMNYLVNTIFYVFESFIYYSFGNDEISFFLEFYSFMERVHPLFMRPEDSIALMPELQEPITRELMLEPPVSKTEDLFEPREPQYSSERVKSPDPDPHPIIDIAYQSFPEVGKSLSTSPPPPPPLKYILEDSQEMNPDIKAANFTPPKDILKCEANNQELQLSELPVTPPPATLEEILDDQMNLNPIVEYPSSPPPLLEGFESNETAEQRGLQSEKIAEELMQNVHVVTESPDCASGITEKNKSVETLNSSSSSEESAPNAPVVTERPDSPLLACSSDYNIEDIRRDTRSQDLSRINDNLVIIGQNIFKKL